MPWKRSSSYRTSWKRVALMLLAAFLTGLIACCISSKISNSYSKAADKYSTYSAIKARYSGQNLNDLLKKYQASGKR